MDEDVDPILEYLIDFNETNQIRYRGRRMIPVNGLKEMLSSYQRFHLDRAFHEEEAQITPASDLDELMKLLD